MRVLLVEDSVADAALVERTLKWVDPDLVLRRVRDEWQLRAELTSSAWDLILSDLVLPSFTGLEALGIVQEDGRDIPFILLSGVVGEGAALAAMRAGAHDFLSKNDLSRLPAVVERELREAATRSARRAADAELAVLRAELARQAERHAAFLTRLRGLASACGDRRDADALAATAARHTQHVVEADAGLCLREPAGGEWLFATSRDGSWRVGVVPEPDNVLVAAAHSPEPRVISGPVRLLRLPSGGTLSAAAACVLPLPGVAGPVGGLAVWAAGARDFGPDDVATLEVIAALVGPALESIQLSRLEGEMGARTVL